MNRASALDMALARRSTTALLVGLLLVGIWWALQSPQSHDASYWLMPGLCVVLLRRCRQARERVAAVLARQRQWNAMAGYTTQSHSRGASGRAGAGASGRIGRTLTLWLLWAFGGAWCAVVPASDPKTPYAAMLFLGLTAWGAFAVVRALGRRVLRRARSDSSSDARRSQAREHVVSICLSKPGSSPSLAHITRALPPYCRALLQRSRIAQSDPQEAPSPMH
jgi:hypothetical protein